MPWENVNGYVGGIAVNERNLEVLEQYEVEVREVRRGRGAFLCETDQGWKLLKEYRGTVKRLEFEEEVLRYLRSEAGILTDQYRKTLEGNLISIASDGTKYILKDWFLDRECDLRSKNDVFSAVRGLAYLHKYLRKIEWKEEWDLGSNAIKPLANEMAKHNRELIRVRNFVRNKRKKTEFELCVIGNFNRFYQQAEEAAKGLLEIGEQNVHYLCHGDMNQHHILMCNSEREENNHLAFIEFNRMHRGSQIEDLYGLLRKTMEKSDWDCDLGMDLLEAYHEVLPLSEQDRQILYYLFLYPEKYWKQMNFYLNNNKVWIPMKNIEKLRQLEEQFSERDEFLQKICEKSKRL